MSKKMIVGEGISAENAAWTFGGDIPKKFNEHVEKSVPLYSNGHELVTHLSDFFVKPNSTCYELGVSTGQLIRKLAAHHKKSVKWVGIDSVPEMIEQAKLQIQGDGISIENIELISDDINLFQFEKSDFIVSYYTIQFVPPHLRQDLFNEIYSNLNWGGALVLFEKVRASDARFQDIATSLYTDFKLNQGYSSDEIIAKSRSLKGVMEPFSTQGNIDMLKRAGFVDIESIFKWVCFEGFLCIK